MAKSWPYQKVLKALENPVTIREIGVAVYGYHDKYVERCVHTKISKLRSMGYTVLCTCEYKGRQKMPGVYWVKV